MPTCRKAIIGVSLAAASILAVASPAWAQFTGSGDSAAQTAGTAVVPAPTGLAAKASAWCIPGWAVQVTVSWTAPTAVDADTNPLVSYYRLTTSVDQGPSTQWGRTGVATSYVGPVECSGRYFTTMTVVIGVQAASSATGFASSYATTTVRWTVL